MSIPEDMQAKPMAPTVGIQPGMQPVAPPAGGWGTTGLATSPQAQPTSALQVQALAPQVQPSSAPQVQATAPQVQANVAPQLDSKELAIEQELARAPTPCRIRRYQFKPDLPLGAVGKGAFGVVYRARRGERGEECAIKMIEGASKQMKTLGREIDIMRGLSHPSIVCMVDVFKASTEDWMFIVMEFVQGGDLLLKVTKEPHLFDECLIRALFFHISCGLAYAHSQGILHRDIKPENVLLCTDGFPKLADFGMSRSVKGEAEWGKTCAGTPFYKAPEVMSHYAAIYEFPADVFSAGSLLLDMLHPEVCMAGVFHLMRDTEQARFKKVWPDANRPRFSDTLKNIHARMVDQLPGKRGSMHQTCEELQELARRDPMPHPFWSRETLLPEGPPAQKVLSPEGAAEIAGRLGYALNCGVNVLIQGQWLPGYVKVISESICPGALNICFKDEAGQIQEVLVCPWHFEHLLRPNPKAIELFIGEQPKEEMPKEQNVSKEVRTRSSRQNATARPVGEEEETSTKICWFCCKKRKSKRVVER